MSDSFTVDLPKYQQAINRLVYELGADAQQLLQEEMRLLLRDLIRLTPPHNFKEGRNAVSRDLAKVYETTRAITKKLKDAGDPGAARAFNRALSRGDTTLAAQIASGTTGQSTNVRVRDYTRHGQRSGRVSAYTRRGVHFRSKIPGITPGTPIVAELNPAVHINRRNNYGRVNGSYISQIVQSAKSYSAYVKAIWDRIGFAKAGFAGAYTQLGGQVPDWIGRLVGKAPSNLVQSFTADDKSITVRTTAIKIPGFERTLARAMYDREASLVSEVHRLVSGGRSRRASLAGTEYG